MYKYKCRGCPVQEQCIEQSGLARGAKEMIRNAFAVRTDTLSTWGVLQKNCLLLKEEEEIERRAREGSLLGRRVREARAAQDEPAGEAAEDETQPADQIQISPIIIGAPEAPSVDTADLHPSGPAPPTSPLYSDAPAAESTPSEPVPSPGTRIFETVPPDQPPVPAQAVPCWLVLDDSQRRVSLPVTGELVLGRFDPQLRDPLDIDLTYEDRNTLTVSRRHAKIVGVEGRHLIKDLGSSNGLFLNAVRIMPNHAHPLQPGDQIMLGALQMQYEAVSADFLGLLALNQAQARHFLFVTHTGHKIALASPEPVIIGRPDPPANFMPGLDLSRYGELATYVSRRHALITWSDGSPYLKDLQSTFGTRLNGQPLPPHQDVPLKPGDHMSLGGCVLAYDVEV